MLRGTVLHRMGGSRAAPRLSRVYASGLELPRLAIRDAMATASGAETPFLQQVNRQAGAAVPPDGSGDRVSGTPPTVPGIRLSGLTADETHRALNEPDLSPATTAALRRMGLALRAAERTGPGDDPSLRPERAWRAGRKRSARSCCMFASARVGWVLPTLGGVGGGLHGGSGAGCFGNVATRRPSCAG